MASAHPGFQGAASSISAKEGVSKGAADRILGYAKAHASEKAKQANPHLTNTPHHVLGGRFRKIK